MRIVSKVRQLRFVQQAKLGRKLSIQEVADAIGISRERMTQIELGRMQEIDTDTLAKICKFYGVKVGDVLEFEEETAEKQGTPRLAVVFSQL